jgi:hypothetical protein
MYLWSSGAGAFRQSLRIGRDWLMSGGAMAQTIEAKTIHLAISHFVVPSTLLLRMDRPTIHRLMNNKPKLITKKWSL